MMNTCMIMHNMIIVNEHAQNLEYDMYDLMGQ
jgi:hypothetical protein